MRRKQTEVVAQAWRDLPLQQRVTTCRQCLATTGHYCPFHIFQVDPNVGRDPRQAHHSPCVSNSRRECRGGGPASCRRCPHRPLKGRKVWPMPDRDWEAL